jgi:hypothetical protein
MLDWRANQANTYIPASPAQEHLRGKEDAARLAVEFGYDLTTLSLRELNILELAAIRVEAYKQQARVLSDRLIAQTFNAKPFVSGPGALFEQD